MSIPMRRVSFFVFISIALYASTLSIRDVPAEEIPEKPDWKLVWNDEFSDSEIDRDVWKFEKGFIRNKEPQYYTDRKENAYVEDGKLVIETRYEEYEGAPYTSASLNTKGTKSFQYGRIEMYAKLPCGQAIWPAFWMMGIHGNWPKCGEIDIMELWGGPNKRWGKDKTGGWGDGVSCAKAHWFDDDKKTQNVGNCIELPEGEKFADKFHIFAIEWTEDEIVWFVDDAVVDRMKLETEGQKSCFRQPHYILINTAVAPYVKPDPTPEVFPAKYYVDYIRVYEKKP